MSEESNEKPDGFVLYRPSGEGAGIRLRLSGRTAWLTQVQMAELFATTKQNISLHVLNILEEGEQQASATVKEYLTVQTEGSRQVQRRVAHYSLEMILAVGFRVQSERGTAFRRWAAATLGEYLTKGFILDDWRLKEGTKWGDDYFDELLAKIRDIRSSERRFYQKITDIYATSINYHPSAVVTKQFFQTVQNKMHWAAHGHTAAEVVAGRADAAVPNMGLTSWKNAPDGAIRKGDVVIAKNYLSQEEIQALNLIVSAYLDFAELQATSRRPMYMKDWISKLDDFLKLSERDILTHAGKISHADAEAQAHEQFELFEQQRRRLEATEPSSDFDRFIEEARKLKPPEKPDNTKKRGKKKE